MNTSDGTNLKNSVLEKFIKELLTKLSDPVHQRLIQAYQGNNPLQSMETELGKILIEVLDRED